MNTLEVTKKIHSSFSHVDCCWRPTLVFVRLCRERVGSAVWRVKPLLCHHCFLRGSRTKFYYLTVSNRRESTQSKLNGQETSIDYNLSSCTTLSRDAWHESGVLQELESMDHWTHSRQFGQVKCIKKKIKNMFVVCMSQPSA